MSKKETKQCSKCGGEMKRGVVPQPTAYGFRFKVQGEFWGSRIIPFACQNCGYIELYREKNDLLL